VPEEVTMEYIFWKVSHLASVPNTQLSPQFLSIVCSSTRPITFVRLNIFHKSPMASTHCSICNGTGYEKCIRCNGMGKNDEECSPCNSSGVYPVVVPGGEGRICYNCNGKGWYYTACSLCHGSGYDQVTCQCQKSR
jgi:DnaJ-class molecular chaperone